MVEGEREEENDEILLLLISEGTIFDELTKIDENLKVLREELGDFETKSEKLKEFIEVPAVDSIGSFGEEFLNTIKENKLEKYSRFSLLIEVPALLAKESKPFIIKIEKNREGKLKLIIEKPSYAKKASVKISFLEDAEEEIKGNKFEMELMPKPDATAYSSDLNLIIYNEGEIIYQRKFEANTLNEIKDKITDSSDLNNRINLMKVGIALLEDFSKEYYNEVKRVGGFYKEKIEKLFDMGKIFPTVRKMEELVFSEKGLLKMQEKLYEKIYKEGTPINKSPIIELQTNKSKDIEIQKVLEILKNSKKLKDSFNNLIEMGEKSEEIKNKINEEFEKIRINVNSDDKNSFIGVYENVCGKDNYLKRLNKIIDSLNKMISQRDYDTISKKSGKTGGGYTKIIRENLIPLLMWICPASDEKKNELKKEMKLNEIKKTVFDYLNESMVLVNKALLNIEIMTKKIMENYDLFSSEIEKNGK